MLSLGRELGKNRVKSPRIKNGVDRFLVLIFIRDTNSHSVTDINRNWNKRGTCDRRRRRRRRRLK